MLFELKWFKKSESHKEKGERIMMARLKRNNNICSGGV